MGNLYNKTKYDRSENMSLQATNAGIDYQCRVSAWFLLNMLFENKLSKVLSSYPDKLVVSVQLEGDSEIDDLILKLENEEYIYFQIKRKINFSISENSEFYKVISQFVNQSLTVSNQGRFVLATSSKSSNKIIDNLRRMLDSIRMSSIEETKSQFNKSDIVLWTEFSSLCEQIHEKNTGKKISQAELSKLVEQIYIDTFDIEEGDNYEKMVYLFINNHTEFDSKLLWSTLIKFSLTLASNRRNITLEKIKKEFKTYLSVEPNSSDYQEEFTENIDTSYVWKDYIVATSEDLAKEMNCDVTTLFIFDMYRFNEDGKKKLNFELPNSIQVSDIPPFNVLFRGSSLLGVGRFIESNKSEMDDYKNTIFIPSNDSDDINKFEEMHLEWLKKELNRNIGEKSCIVCGDIFNDNEGFIIEVDNTFEPNEAGPCHLECLRPIDRVMGRIGIKKEKNAKYLRNFDSNKWLESIQGGQGMITGLGILNNNIKNVFWNPNYDSYPNAKYCVRTKLENGDYVYTKDRGKVDRLSRQAARKLAREFDERHKKAYRTNNPVCYSNKSYTYGPYEVLKNEINPSEKLIPCVSTEATRYNKHLSKLYDTCSNFYAPLIMFYLEDEIFEIDNIVPVTSDPFELEEYFDSWGCFVSGINESISLRIIENDLEFDNIVRQLKIKSKNVVINPKLGINKELISGAILLSKLDL